MFNLSDLKEAYQEWAAKTTFNREISSYMPADREKVKNIYEHDGEYVFVPQTERAEYEYVMNLEVSDLNPQSESFVWRINSFASECGYSERMDLESDGKPFLFFGEKS